MRPFAFDRLLRRKGDDGGGEIVTYLFQHAINTPSSSKETSAPCIIGGNVHSSLVCSHSPDD
jgi:hypothetical protein